MQATHFAAIDAEAALQRQLAKKLGIKGKKRKAPEATMHEALDELDALFAGVLPFFLSAHLAIVQALTMKWNRWHSTYSWIECSCMQRMRMHLARRRTMSC